MSELGSGGVVQLAERSGSVSWAGDRARHGLAPFIGEESSNGIAQGRRRRGLRQLVVNANSGSTEGASVEAAKTARTLQRRGRGGDAGVGGKAWCRRQCAVPSWGRRGARARARASAGEDGREGASASFIDEVRRFARQRKNLGRHCALS